MSKLVPWSELEQGIDCPFDLPRDGIEEFMCPIRELSAATLYLSRHQTYRGSCVLIFDPRHVTRIDELCSEEWTAFAHDLGVAERAVFRALEPDHMNVASLGAVIPHLHWHIIPRYRNDPRWGGPVWTTRKEDGPRTELEQVDYDALVAAIRDRLDDDV
jgi:diadenosine tetraphosphate (Ap4A) HIT family hydrolase